MRLFKAFFPLLLCGMLPAADSVTLDTGTGVLYGTLEIPSGKAPFPVVLLIAGSGPTDRDGNSALIPGKNDSLKMIAQGLAGRGIASLRYDKRGIAASAAAGPREADLRFENYIEDAVRWGEYLRKDSRFGALVIAGHSEGSLIGMPVAQKLSADGYISLSGAGLPAGQIILRQLRAQSISPDHMKPVEAAVKSLEEGRKPDSMPQGLDTLFPPSVQPYLISWFKYDPAKEIAKLKMPILILQGTTDIQVSVSDANLLKDANPSAKLVVIEGMNHILKDVPAGQEKPLASYGDPSLPLNSKLLDEMTGLVNRTSKPLK